MSLVWVDLCSCVNCSPISGVRRYGTTDQLVPFVWDHAGASARHFGLVGSGSKVGKINRSEHDPDTSRGKGDMQQFLKFRLLFWLKQ